MLVLEPREYQTNGKKNRTQNIKYAAAVYLRKVQKLACSAGSEKC